MRMKVTGVLKVPGFSTYLHPLGDGRLLGVGQGATAGGVTTGSKVSLFDVSNATRPQELATWMLTGSASVAQWDHRAFLYWAPERVAVLPVDLYEGNDGAGFSGAIALKIGNDSMLSTGRIAHPRCCGSFPYPQPIERNLVLGKLSLWSLSRSTLQVNDIRSLKFRALVKLPDSV